MTNPFQHFLDADGPAALVLREYLMPVEGRDGVLFPATFAAGQGFSGGYNIDGDPAGDNVCLIDSVGSQANRIEPLFADEPLSKLVPQIVVKAGDRAVNLLHAGHRAGDALVRCSALKDSLQKAFKAVLRGNAESLAKIAPTSLVFGVWDSRDTQAKLPRLVASTIRAFNVKPLTRGAVYVPPVDYAALEVFSAEDKEKAEGDPKNPLAKRGFVHVPASASHGGVIATGGIRRDATLSLSALRTLQGESSDRTQALRQYILALSLLAFIKKSPCPLRQGCLLVVDPEKEVELVEVYANGQRKKVSIDEKALLKFAEEAAKDFGIGPDQTVDFEKEKAKGDLKEGGKGKEKAKGKRGAKKETVESDAEEQS